MTLARVCQFGYSPIAGSLLRAPATPKSLLPRIQAIRLYANETRTGFTRSARQKEPFAQRMMAPATGTAINVGRAITLGSATVGLGALCYYGLGLSSSAGAADRMAFWPQYVRERIKSTYMHVGASVVITAAVAAMCLRSPTLKRIAMVHSFNAFILSTVAVIGSGIITQNIPYEEGFGIKQIAWLTHLSILGLVLVPLATFGGAALIRAAWCTAGIVGGLSTVAICAPSETFLNMGGPLAIGLGLVIATSLGSFFLPPSTVIGSALYATTYYGGLILFSLLLLYDTQKIIKRAELTPPVTDYTYNDYVHRFDPINNAVSIYLDILNIFVRVVSGNLGRK